MCHQVKEEENALIMTKFIRHLRRDSCVCGGKHKNKITYIIISIIYKGGNTLPFKIFPTLKTQHLPSLWGVALQEVNSVGVIDKVKWSLVAVVGRRHTTPSLGQETGQGQRHIIFETALPNV